MPERIQHTGAAGLPEGAIYVGAPSKWANPWLIVPVNDPFFPFSDAADVRHAETRDGLGRFDRYTRSPRTGAPYWATRAYERDLSDELVESARHELGGKDLACACPLDQPCHADVLLRLANEEGPGA